jgi:hypothetical protein
VAEIAHGPVGLAHRHAIERQGRAKDRPILLEAVDPNLQVLLTAPQDQLQPDETIPAQDPAIAQPQDQLGILEPDLPFEGERRMTCPKSKGENQTENDEKGFAHDFSPSYSPELIAVI